MEELVNYNEFIDNDIASMVSNAGRRKGRVGNRDFLLSKFSTPKESMSMGASPHTKVVGVEVGAVVGISEK